MVGDFTTCTAMFGSGARIAMKNMRELTWLIRKDQESLKIVCCVAVRGVIILCSAARLIEAHTILATVANSAVCVSVSPWIEFPTTRFFQKRSPRIFSALQKDTEKTPIFLFETLAEPPVFFENPNPPFSSPPALHQDSGSW